MIVNRCSENLLTKSKKLYENYRDNCTVVQRMLEKYKKIYPNISDYSIRATRPVRFRYGGFLFLYLSGRSQASKQR